MADTPGVEVEQLMQNSASVNASRSRTTKLQRAIIRAEAELALESKQRPAWNAFVGIADEAERAIAAVDNTASDATGYRPSLPMALETTCHRLAVRLAAACRIASAAAVMQGTLSSRQRARADRLLTAITKELSMAPAEATVEPSPALRSAAGRSATHPYAAGRTAASHVFPA